MVDRKKFDKKIVTLKQEAKNCKTEVRSWKNFEVGDIVQVQHCITRRWNLTGKVIQILPHENSYKVMTSCGRVYWRDRSFLRCVMHKTRKKDAEAESPKEDTYCQKHEALIHGFMPQQAQGIPRGGMKDNGD